MVTTTQDRTAVISPAIGSVIRDRIRDLRERAGLGRDELAERAREHGAGETMTANVIGFLERGRRGLAVDELLALAQALEVSPLELLGDAAAAFIGDAPAAGCPTCDAGETGPLEAAVVKDTAGLGELRELEASMVATARRLAREIDQAGGDTVKMLPQLTRELRNTLVQIATGRRGEPDEDGDDLDDLDDPD